MDPREHVSKSILFLADNQVMYRDMEVGQILGVRGHDTKDDEERQTYLQLVYKVENEKDDTCKGVFAIVDSDFHFTDRKTHEPVSVKVGTLAMSGFSMFWLPSPVYRMVGIGGVGLGRDYSLEYVNGQTQALIIPHITEIVLSDVPEDYVTPNGLEEFLQKVAALKAQEQEARSPERMAEYRATYMGWLQEQIKPGTGNGYELVETIHDDLDGLCLLGLYSIGDFLVKAHQQGKLQHAIEVVKQGFSDQWSRQHPEMCGDPSFGSNAEYLERCYAQADVEFIDNASTTTLSDNADEHLVKLRSILADESTINRKEVERVVISEQAQNQILIFKTGSGNRYLVEVADPTNNLVNIMSYRVRLGFPEDGYFPNEVAESLEVGYGHSSEGLSTSRIKKIYLV